MCVFIMQHILTQQYNQEGSRVMGNINTMYTVHSMIYCYMCTIICIHVLIFKV